MNKDIVLITGGLGYVGGRISKYLQSQTNCFIRIGTRNTKIEKPKWLTNGEIIKLDMLDDETMNKACKNVKYIIHLAALNEIESSKFPEDAVDVNVKGTVKLIKHAKANNIKRFIYFSTAHVYGSPLIGDITEETLPKPLHPYAITHKVSEDFILAENRFKDSFKGIVLRLSNSFGVPVSSNVNRWTLIVNDLCRQAVENKKLLLKSDGMQIRDFITLHDVVRAIDHFLALSDEKLKDGLFNLGGENSLKILDITEKIKERTKYVLEFDPEIVKEDKKSNQEVSLNYSIDKLKNTGFKLSGDIDKEIDDTLRLCASTWGSDE